MKRIMVAATAVVIMLSAVMLANTLAEENRKEVIGFTPEQVKWFTPSYYKDGRKRAQLFGDSGKGGTWVDRVKIPAGMRILAHTHPLDEQVTVIEGMWYMGEGEKFDAAKLQGYPAGSFIIIPAGVPHFVAVKDGPVIVQLNGIGKFGTDYLEK